jgi:hypothetical protein
VLLPELTSRSRSIRRFVCVSRAPDRGTGVEQLWNTISWRILSGGLLCDCLDFGESGDFCVP